VFGSRTRSTGGSPSARPTAPAPIKRDRAKVAETFAPGDRVSHKTFGPGVVRAASGDTIEVFFTRTGKTKKLMKGFAPIVKVEG
jgi:DNA helicase-2/ATP-dependent DNA helicase PcrA